MATIKNEFFQIQADNKYKPFLDTLLQRLTDETMRVRDFFGEPNFKQVKVTIYDDKKKLMEEALASNKHYEEYGEGAFSKDEIDVLFKDELTDANLYTLVNRVVHQYSHVLYAPIYEGRFERPLWLDEGLAQVISRERVLLSKSDKRCKSVFLSRILNKHKEIPDIEFLKKEGGSYKSIGSSKYNGYLMCYFMVRYLMEAKVHASDNGLDGDKKSGRYNYEEMADLQPKNKRPLVPRYDLKSIMKDKEAISEIEKYIVGRTINYTGSSLGISMAAASYKAIKTPEDLMDYMDANFTYGWLDDEKVRHTFATPNMKEKYRVSSVDDMLHSSIGTTADKAKFVADTLKKLGYSVSIFFTMKKGEKGDTLRPFVLYSSDDKYYYFGYSSENRKGIYGFDSLDDFTEYCKEYMDEETELYETYDIPDGKSFAELVEYISSQDKIIGENMDYKYAQHGSKR